MSKNVFADLEMPEPDERLLKAELASQVGDIIERRGLKQDEIAQILGIDQPKVSAIKNGRLRGFSVVRLYKFLNALGKDVRIVVSDVTEKRPGWTVIESGVGAQHVTL